jgi:hypothetical protein
MYVVQFNVRNGKASLGNMGPCSQDEVGYNGYMDCRYNCTTNANYFSLTSPPPAILLGSLAHGSLSSPTSILVDLIISSSFIALEQFDLLGRHQARYQIRLDLFE